MRVEPAGTVILPLRKPQPNLVGTVQWLKHRSKLREEWSSKNNYGCQHCDNIKEGEERNRKERTRSEIGTTHPGSHEIAQATDSDTRKPNSDAEKVQANVGNDKGKKKKQFENRFDFEGLRSHLSSK